jgi:hypothetical protein
MSDAESKPPEKSVGDAERAVLATSRKHTRRSFAIAALSAVAGWEFCKWVYYSPAIGMQPLPRRRMFEANAKLSQAIFDDRALAPTFPLSRAEKLRVNGYIGLKTELRTDSWRLQVVGVENAAGFPQYSPDVTAWNYEYAAERDAAKANGTVEVERAGKFPRGLEEAGLSTSTLPAGTPGLLLTLPDITKLPKHELVTEFKCIEGWSQIAHFSGVRMADFIDAYPPARKPDGSLPRYVYMETPNGDYYVGYDMHVCQHPQTLLVTEMAGEPLSQFHGAPLRLHAPTKYGYKQIKRIGLIAYSDVKPDDYWTKLGYDWYAGL